MTTKCQQGWRECKMPKKTIVRPAPARSVRPAVAKTETPQPAFNPPSMVVPAGFVAQNVSLEQNGLALTAIDAQGRVIKFSLAPGAADALRRR